MKNPSVYLKHIQDAIARIESYTGHGRKAFFDNTMVQDAVIRNLEVIGHPRIPWRSITALRNVLIHEYFGVDLEIVWRVVEKRLPALKQHVGVMLSRMPTR